MKEDLLNHLVCPECSSNFTLRGDEARVLTCPNSHRFPIKNGVPQFSSDIADLEQDQTSKSFGDKWTYFSEIAFSDDARKQRFNWKLEKYGFGNEENLKSFLSNKDLILDAGCGLGIDASWYSKLAPQSKIFGVDLSRAVSLANDRFGKISNIHFLQGDLTKLPFRKNYFDLITSEGVLHHTPDTEKSFKYLTNFLSEEGEIAAYVYRKKSSMREFLDEEIREKTTEMATEKCLEFSEKMTEIGEKLSEIDIEIEGMPLQRYIHWNVMKCFWNKEVGFEYSKMVNFDWYHPKYAHRHEPSEIKKWIEESGLSIINFDNSKSGITFRAKKIE